MKKIVLPVYILLISISYAAAQPVDVGVGMNFVPGSGSRDVKKSTAVPTSVFVGNIAKRMNKSPEKMQGLWRKGYGFVELIKLSLIADEAKQPFEKIVEQREKNTKISAIAKKYNLDYENIYRRSYEIKNEVVAETTDYAAEEIGLEISSPTGGKK